MHDDVILHGVFKICLWLVARRYQTDRKIYDEIAPVCDPRATTL